MHHVVPERVSDTTPSRGYENPLRATAQASRPGPIVTGQRDVPRYTQHPVGEPFRDANQGVAEPTSTSPSDTPCRATNHTPRGK